MKMLSNLQTGLKPKLQDKVDWLISCGMYNFVEELFIQIELYKFQFITFLVRLKFFDHDESLLVQGISFKNLTSNIHIIR